MKNIFDLNDSQAMIDRINLLQYDTIPGWGRMDVAQMLAHCNVTYEMVYTNIHPVPNVFMKFLLKIMVKNFVVSEKPYPKNSHTAKQFIIKGDHNFDVEKLRLIDYIRKTQELGIPTFEGKESHSFGKLTAKEWNNMFAKHLDHHLNQFGV